jgi:uncharacterized protein (TIGR00369 family)
MTDSAPATPRDGSDVVRTFIPASPFSAALGVVLEHIEDGRAVVRMPYDESRTTYADIVHGGAIAGLIDVAVMATAWAGAPLPESMRGVTVSLSTQYVDAAKAEDLAAEGRVIRRGRSLTNVEVDVRGEDGRVVAKAVGVYKVG